MVWSLSVYSHAWLGNGWVVGLPSRGPSVLLYAHLPQGVFVKYECKKEMFQKSNSSRKCIKRYILYSIPHSSAMNFLSNDFRIYLPTRLCRSRPVGKNTCSAYICVTLPIYIAKTRINRHKIDM